MVEMVVCRVDVVNSTDKYLDAQCYKRGYVIEVKETGWPFTKTERENPNWIIIQSDMSMGDAMALLESEPRDKTKTAEYKRRIIKLDLDAATTGLSAEQKYKDVTPYKETFYYPKLDLASYVENLQPAKTVLV